MKLSIVVLALLFPSSQARWGQNGGGGGGGGQGSGGNASSGTSSGTPADTGRGNGGQGGGGGGGNGGRNGGRGGGSGNGGAVPAATTPLDETEKNDILFMREEEKLARDVYLTFSDMYDLPVFANIAESEQVHMDRMESLIETYDLVDPVVDETNIGTFTNSDLQTMYTDLVTEGEGSLLSALMVGARIEEIDIEDLEIAIEESDQADTDFVYGRLLRASHNHLRGFVREIELLGEVYVAQVLPQEEVNGILNR